MTSQPSVSKGVDPLVDRILSNPLTFKPGKNVESDSIDLKGYIRLGKKKEQPAVPKDKPDNNAIDNSKPRPKSMAEAVAAYAGKKFLTRKEKRSKLRVTKPPLVDSDEEDLGEETTQTKGPQRESSDSLSDSNYESASEYPPHSEQSTPTLESSQDLQNSDDSDDDFVAKEGESSSPSDSSEAYRESDKEYDGESDKSYKSDNESKQPLVSSDEDRQGLKQDLREDANKPLSELHVPPGAIAEHQPKQAESTPPTSPESSDEKETLLPLDGFYGHGEYINDQGSNESQRIYKHWKQLQKRKPVGLLNHGVTCYMNSAIQSMIHIPAFQHYLNDIYDGNYDNVLKPRSVSHVLAELSKRMWGLDDKKNKKPAKYVNPKRIILRLDDINCMMSEWQQEDSHEYFMSLMSRLQEDSTPKGSKLNTSIIYDIFGGLLNQKVTCCRCSTVSETKQEFYDLSLGLSKRRSGGSKFSIENSIGDFFSKETIKAEKGDQSTGYYCEKCKQKTTANKISTIDQSPETLTIHLKRFKFDGNSSSKVKQSISYSNHLELTQYTTEKVPTMYKLISVIVHEGRSLSSGHYIAHCLQPDGTWSTYDDEYINRINEKEALSDPSAYVLVYTKLTPKSSKRPLDAPAPPAKKRKV